MIAGIEVGRAGLGLRVVKPIWHNYDFLGTVEFGGSIENILATPANTTKVDYAVGIFSKAFKKSKFFYADKTKYSYNDMHVYNFSSATIKRLIASKLIDKIGEIISLDGNYYMVKNIPLKDFSSDQIGYLLLSRDTTIEVEAMYSELIKQILIIFSYAIATIAILTVILLKIIFNPLEKITSHISSVRTGKDIPRKPLKLKGHSEITTLAEAFNVLSKKLAESFDQINSQMNEIQAMNASLEKRVKERTQELENTNSRLTSAMKEINSANEAKSEFLASMSHEIRTPMNAVLGLSYLIMQTELSSKQYDYVNKIRNSANLLLEIINDVLDFSKIEAGKLELEEAPFNLKECVQRLAGLMEVSVSKKDVEIKVHIDEAIPDYLIGDQLRFTQVLNNLGTNASKFTDTGSIELTASLLTKNENYSRIKVEVSDTGMGIPKDKLPILFDSFTQVKSKDSKRHGGSGLGLSITKKILAAMDSDISVESREGKGSTFSFILTLLTATESDIEQIKTPERKLSGKRILVCEPEDIHYGNISSFLRENLADVLNTSNQFDLMKHISNNTDCNNNLMFDLMILDSRTLSEDSFTTIKSTLDNLNSQNLPPVILVSGDTNLTSVANTTLTNTRLFVIHKSECIEKIPELAYELLSSDSTLTPDLECLKRSRIDSSEIYAMLVDDNDINLQVVTEFADILGISYKTAKNGMEAIRLAKEESFDIIFMDIIMPEMDGITATRHIREIEKCKNIPIYALSASTMPNDIEKCLDAGMDGHIAKPVKIRDLTNAIKDLSKGHSSVTSAPEADDVLIPPSDEIMNTELALSNLNGNKKLYSDLLKKFLSEYQGLDIIVENKILNEDFNNLKIFFHTIKGVSRTLGAQKLSLISEKLEKMASNNEGLKNTKEVDDFKTETLAIDNKLKNFYKDR